MVAMAKNYMELNVIIQITCLKKTNLAPKNYKKFSQEP